jgi:diacylglycerol kinase (ATP)
MKQKIRFIINPISGGGKNRHLAPVILSHMDTARFDCEFSFTERARHATELSREAAQAGYYAVVAVGGDGSVNEVGQGLAGSRTALGIIPRGSGNGLAHHLRIPVTLSSAVRRINEGKITPIDSLSINEHICMGIAGIGFDAHVAHEFARQPKRGLITYCKVIFSEYGKFASIPFEFSIGGQEYRREAFLITFANSSQYGNMARIAPQADVQDGMMEVCVLRKVPVLKTLSFVWKLFTRQCHTSPFLEIIRTPEITIYNYEGRILHIDGEPVYTGSTVHVQVRHLSVNVIC